MNSLQISSRASSSRISSSNPSSASFSSVDRPSTLFRFASFVILLVLSLSPAAFAAEDVDLGSEESVAVAAVLNINEASVEQLALVLSGVGEVKAQAIVEWRNTHGEFTSIEQLLEVKGVGAATLSKNSHKISI
ncbi:MAG: hypothetical protein COA42_00325 [Alteromonadaceae bacterium]|nr:MAG: hypothetical protein COA42_00325 [Alteromonadaceae bacterium]